MAFDPQAGRTPPETVVEFGADPAESRPRRQRWSATEIVASLAADRRAVPLAAAVGAVALFASLVSEWQITVLSNTDFGENAGGNRPLATGLADLGALGGGFLAGLFLLAGAMVLVLFGPLPGRRYAQLLGLSTGGVLLAILVALSASLDDTSHALVRMFPLDLDEDRMQLSYGRGIWCAFFGVAAVLLALYLAGRHTGPVPAAEPDAEYAAEETPVVWSWRRPKDVRDEDDRTPDAPFDLTVAPTNPFTSLTDDRDKPTERGRST